ncbi:MAG TPA: hypothetical protein PK765_00210 [bacterium]|nr:hypothetical protein [bacterium]
MARVLETANAVGMFAQFGTHSGFPIAMLCLARRDSETTLRHMF